MDYLFGEKLFRESFFRILFFYRVFLFFLSHFFVFSRYTLLHSHNQNQKLLFFLKKKDINFSSLFSGKYWLIKSVFLVNNG